MKKIKTMAVFAMLVVMTMFSSCGAKAMSISEAVEAINNLEHGGSITIVLNSDVSRITDELTVALSADDAYLKRVMIREDVDDATELVQKYGKKVSLDLSKTKITEIENGAFHNCVSLTSVTIPDSVTSIGDYAFTLSSLMSVTIPNSVKSIGEAAFGATLLTSVTIPASVTSIGKGAFYWCSNLTSVTIPDSVTSIEKDAFNSDVSVTYEGKTASWSSIYYEFFRY